MFLKLTFLYIFIFEILSSVTVEEYAQNFLDSRNEISLLKVDFLVIQNLTLDETDLDEKWKDLEKYKYTDELILLKEKPTTFINFEGAYIPQDSSPKLLSIELPKSEVVKDPVKQDLNKPEPFLFERLPFQEEMIEIQNNLDRSKDYRVLYYNSWIQPAVSEKKSVPIYIEAFKKDKKIYGEIKVYKERFFHLNSRLRLSQKTENISNSSELPQTFDFQKFLKVEEKVEPGVETNLNYWIDTIFNSVKINFNYVTDFLGTNNKLTSEPLVTSPEYIYEDLFEISKGMKIDSEDFTFVDHPYFSILIRIREIND